jgi:membrane-associated phospholipid phosphatase
MHTSDLRRVQRGFAGAALRVLLALSIFISTVGAHADVVEGASTETSENSEYFYNPIESFKEGGRAVFDSKGKWVLLGAAGAIGAARIFDKQLQATFNDKHRFGAFETLGNNFFGTGLYGTVLGGGLWAYGNLANKSRERSAGQAEIEALIAAQLIVSGIKYAVHRERPDHSDSLSFPSGHNTLAWTTAAVVHEFYGWKWGALGYAAGAITMVGRMGANKHWFSDTVGGAAAGIIIGGAIARAHKKRLEDAENKKWTMQVRPQFQQGAPGLLLTVSF